MIAKRVNIGLIIEQKINELELSKSEFGRRIGIPQQNVNRILDKPNIDTDKLVAISNALDYNFFNVFTDEDVSAGNISAVNSSVSLHGNSSNNVTTEVSGDAVLLERVKSLEALLAEKGERIAELKERIEELKSR